MIKDTIKKYLKEIIYITLFIIVIGFEITILILKDKENYHLSPEIEIKNNNIETTEEKTIKFEIKGEVNAPGVYEIKENSRVIDAIHLAGELKETANTNYINLSKKIDDEMVIIIYSNEDIANYQKGNQKIEYIYLEKECTCPDPINAACIKEENVYATEETKENSEPEKNNKININTASLEELTTLSGIGESKAKKIIEYREKTPFKTIEELNEVNGIGNSIYEKIKDNITV